MEKMIPFGIIHHSTKDKPIFYTSTRMPQFSKLQFYHNFIHEIINFKKCNIMINGKNYSFQVKVSVSN